MGPLFKFCWMGTFPCIKLTDTLVLCETDLDDSIDSGNFSVTGYLSLIWMDSVTYMHGLAVYLKEGLPFAWDLSLKNSTDSYLCFPWLYYTECLFSFSAIDHLHLYTWFLIVSSNTGEVLFITHLSMCLSLVTLVSIIKTG